jgi:hypothetical protein
MTSMIPASSFAPSPFSSSSSWPKGTTMLGPDDGDDDDDDNIDGSNGRLMSAAANSNLSLISFSLSFFSLQMIFY